MQAINKTHSKYFSELPIKALQIGEGNFLRAFADYIVETADRAGVFNGSVMLAQPIERGLAEKINAQNGQYTVIMRGIEAGEVVEKTERISCVAGCIDTYNEPQRLIDTACLDTLEIVISNTTEAGITYVAGEKADSFPAVSYPAKLTVLLYERFKKFGGDPEKGLLILPVELIEKNGARLHECVLKYSADWALGDAFVSWLETACCFASTLVDRIVTGYPREEAIEIENKLGYTDALLDTCEPFLFWVIECDESFKKKFPIDNIGLNIIFTADMTPYRTRKVRILNGAHTVSVLAAHLCGHETVLEMMKDELFNAYIRCAMFEEIIPTVDLPQEELEFFANAVLERFANPFIKHRLLDISLNSVSKFKARCLCSLLDSYKKNGALPDVLVFGLAALIEFYKGEMRGEKCFGSANGSEYEIRDDGAVLEFMAAAHRSGDVVSAVLSNKNFWGCDLNEIDGLYEKAKKYFDLINANGIRAAVEEVMQ